jgi:hypothetical protein
MAYGCASGQPDSCPGFTKSGLPDLVTKEVAEVG